MTHDVDRAEDGERLRRARIRAGLTQAALGERSGVSRQTVAAIETGRHAPSVVAALAIARVLGASVEDLFGVGGDVPAIVGAAPVEGAGLRVGRVGSRLVAGAPADDPVSAGGWALFDGCWRDGSVEMYGDVDLDRLVVVGCDPALAIVEALLERRGGYAVTSISAATGEAVRALGDGLCHAVVVHGPAGGLPVAPVAVQRFGFARWQVGLAVPGRHRVDTLDRVVAGRLGVVGRDGGAASQQALDRALGPASARLVARAGGHVDAARKAMALGAAAVTMETAARVFALDFMALEEHEVELWVAEAWAGHPAVEALLDVVASRGFAGRVGALGGYDLGSAAVRL
ncbi:MAG: helix-turn-helix domain-containing protein [Solirubrobacteraceae bacterium]